jgi:hypothetical protein
MSYQNESLGLSLSPKLKESFNTCAVWARIIAIISFVSSGISLFASLAKGSFLSAIITAAISVFINIYLLNFGRRVKTALDSTNQEDFNEGLHDLNLYFKVYGIIMIIAIVLLLLGMLIFGAVIMNNI